MPMSFDNAAHLSQPFQAGLRHDGLKCGSHELLQGRAGRQAWSGGSGPAGRVLERIYQRLEQQDHQQMRQHPRSGRSIVDARRRFQTDQTLQPFEPQLNPPSQSIQGQHIVGGDCVDRQRSDDDETTGSLQRFPRGLARLASLLAHVPPCGLRDGIWFANSDQAQRQRRTALAADFDCAVEPLAARDRMASRLSGCPADPANAHCASRRGPPHRRPRPTPPRCGQAAGKRMRKYTPSRRRSVGSVARARGVRGVARTEQLTDQHRQPVAAMAQAVQDGWI